MGRHENFPEGREFCIGLRDTDLVLDVQGASTEPGTPIILWTVKHEDNDNQKWYYENKQLRNKQTGLILTVPTLSANVAADQQHSGSNTQKFEHYDYTISAVDNEDLVLGILGSPTENARLALVHRDNDSELQQWSII
ncbi:hypothetical protein BG006_002166 [Podila minutissima]|uniref:Ricin B lectin domain-containing protein n=1 Tax=Podila minutissima TaxID=64525 RepID=A0A9P5SA33_9FUNG|nr:hypothetical protein BG006_002166 [Podila minutissima]